MFCRYIFLTLFTIFAGSIYCIQAKQQEQRLQPTGERVAIVPGNQGAVRAESTDESADGSKSSKKKKKEKTPERPNVVGKAIVPANGPQNVKNPQVGNNPKVLKNPQVVNNVRVNRTPQKATLQKTAIVPGKGTSTASKVSKEKKKHSSIHGAAKAVVRECPAQPSRPTHFVTPKPIEKHVHRSVNSGVAIVPSAPQVIPRPAAYPVPIVNVVVQAPQRPVIISRPLPQTVVIDRRSAAYPYATLTPYAISGKGDFIQLEDGSQWKVRHRHYSTVKRWGAGDAILIETGKYFTWSAYKLVNYSRGEFVDVELIEPVCNGLLSHWITEINLYEGYLRLQDGSIWRMSASELLNWSVNDDVAIALSKDWFSSHCSYVLINPRAKNRLIAIFTY